MAMGISIFIGSFRVCVSLFLFVVVVVVVGE
jgi:hypothetical protein